MKLVVRADDFGFTKIYNEGLMKTIDHGIVTTVDLMLDTPGLEDACERIKKCPWISVGWHTHFWWKPVLSAWKVSSLVDETTGRFKSGLSNRNDVDYDEAVAECRAQVQQCIRLLGKAPDTTDLNGTSVFDNARKQVCDEYGIIYHFAEKHMKSPHIASDANCRFEETKVVGPSEAYRDLDIYFPTDLFSLKAVHQDSAACFMMNYDPVQYYREDPDHMRDHKVAVMPWHPGYLDDFMVEVYDNPLLNAARPLDIRALCSDAIKEWIRENRIELVNYRDAIFGTCEYQNHLKAIGSDLAVR